MMLLLTKLNGTKFAIPAESVASCDDQRSYTSDLSAPCYWLKQKNGENWRIKESPEEVFKMIEEMR